MPMGPNALSPDLMTAAERLDEIAAILAAGLMRLRRRKSTRIAGDRGDSSLDFPPGRSIRRTVSRHTEADA
jgi:hypothetical protein